MFILFNLGLIQNLILILSPIVRLNSEPDFDSYFDSESDSDFDFDPDSDFDWV